MVDKRRALTMRRRLGEASELVVDDNFLPMFRNRQEKYKEEFDFSVKLAKRKNNPERYFAKIWSCNSLTQTLEWLRELINLAIGRLAEYRNKCLAQKQQEAEQKFFNSPLMIAYKRKFNLIS